VYFTGVSWVDMHLLADRTHLEEFKKLGLVTGDNNISVLLVEETRVL
jgi:hypothetical protein